MSALESPRVGWDAHQRAAGLLAARDRLYARLPHRIESARPLSAEQRAFVVDDAIVFTSVDYKGTIGAQDELERVFWDAAEKRVARTHDGRYDTVRAGYQRADLASLDELGTQATPENQTLHQAEVGAMLSFLALLEPTEREIFICQNRQGRRRALGAKATAQALGLPLGTVRAAERSIEGKRQRFATIYAAGRLCEFFAPALAALAEGDHDATTATSGIELAARVHLKHERCPTCTADYTRQLRYLRGARFHHQIATLLPVTADDRPARALSRGLRDVLPDWAARVLAHEPANATTQLLTSGAGRGLGSGALLKLATVCAAGAGAVGTCVATGVLPALPRHEPAPRVAPTPSPAPTSTPSAPEPRLPHGAPTPTPTPTPRPHPKRARRASKSSTTQGGAGSRSHEQAPASVAPSNAAPGGASEFDPTYQSSGPAAPAPVPAAPGASEFG
jgi:hypothetical protein